LFSFECKNDSLVCCGVLLVFLLLQQVKRSAKEESRYPLMEEYDFKNDNRNPVLNMDLRPSTRIRVSNKSVPCKLVVFVFCVKKVPWLCLQLL
jgi:hypothetical protein